MSALPRPHPIWGQISLRRNDWESAIARHAAGWSPQEALQALPTGTFYRPQYDEILRSWPSRRAFLEQHGTPAQLQLEQLLFDHLSAQT